MDPIFLFFGIILIFTIIKVRFSVVEIEHIIIPSYKTPIEIIQTLAINEKITEEELWETIRNICGTEQTLENLYKINQFDWKCEGLIHSIVRGENYEK